MLGRLQGKREAGDSASEDDEVEPFGHGGSFAPGV
jgi:hypothetical protein